MLWNFDWLGLLENVLQVACEVAGRAEIGLVLEKCFAILIGRGGWKSAWAVACKVAGWVRTAMVLGNCLGLEHEKCVRVVPTRNCLELVVQTIPGTTIMWKRLLCVGAHLKSRLCILEPSCSHTRDRVYMPREACLLNVRVPMSLKMGYL